MKEVEIDDAIRQDASLLSAVEKATPLLDEAIGRSADSVSAHWEMFAADQQISTVRLEITDGIDSAMVQFPRTILIRLTRSALELRLIHLWGDLLEVRSRKQVQKLNLIVQGLED